MDDSPPAGCDVGFVVGDCLKKARSDVESRSNEKKQVSARSLSTTRSTSRPQLYNNRTSFIRSSSTSVATTTDNNTTRKPRDSIKEERRIKTSRKTLDDYLRKLSTSAQRQQQQGGEGSNGVSRKLSLNQETGTCSFPYQRFLVVIELPQDQPKTVYFYTCVCRLEEQNDNISQVSKTAMELNYLQAATKGSTLGMRSSEVNLCRSIPLKALNPTKLSIALDEFLTTASDVHAKLEKAKRSFDISTADEAHMRVMIRRSRKPQNVRSRTFTT
ncbi:hypothetical protein ACA910_002578 [Epithemia clementina (nom. ined.)]